MHTEGTFNKRKEGDNVSIESRSNQYGTVFDHWQIQELIGPGSGGKTAVFLLKRNDAFQDFSAMKVVNLIEERGRYEDLPAYRKKEYDDALKECKAKAIPEVQMMLDLRGNTNVVDYLDHKFHSWSDSSGFGCDLLIRMELLEDLRKVIRSGRTFTESEILKVGRDIATALVLCHSNGIVHRDIKPENIFVNKKGNFKLGDFGISRILGTSPNVMASTGVGTPEYAAPEQFFNHHDKRVDIYSLGLVLYELCNRNRLPFATSSYVRPEDVEQRRKGTPFPKPEGIDAGLWSVIQKACAHKVADRYSTAQEFLEALCRLDESSTLELPQPVIVPRQPNQTVKTTTTGVDYDTQPALLRNGSNIGYGTAYADKSRKSITTPRKKIGAIKLTAIILVFLLIVGCGVAISSSVKKTAAQKAAITEIIDDAESLSANSDYVAALAKIEEGLVEYPDSADLQEKKGTYSLAIEEDIAHIIVEADAFAANQDYEGAISVINTGLAIYPSTEVLQKKGIEYTDALDIQTKAATLAKAASFAESGDFISAIGLIDEALENHDNDPDYQNAYNTYCAEYKTSAISSADSLAACGDYIGAHEIIDATISLIGEDADLTEKTAEYEAAHVAEVINAADTLLLDGNFDDADKLINDTKRHYPGNTLLKEESDKIKDARPIYLIGTIDPYKTPYYYNSAGMLEMGGQKYSHGFSCMGYGDAPGGNQTYFNLDGKYSEISFTAGIVNDRGRTVTFTFYSDGDPVYSFDMKSGDLPTDHSFSVEGCKQLLIAVYDGKWVADGSGTYGLANIMLRKNILAKEDTMVKTGLSEGQSYLLNVVEPYKTPYYYNSSNFFSMGGHSYSHGFTCMGYGDNPVGNQTYFNLGGKYTTLSFTAGIVTDRGRTVRITIYADGEVIYSLSMDSGELPTTHTIDITGYKQLVFSVYDGKWVADGSGTYGLADIIIS